MCNLANWQTCHIILFLLLTAFSSFLLLRKNLLHLICYVENFVCVYFQMKHCCFDLELCFNFQPIKSEKSLLTRNCTLRNIFSSMLLYSPVKSARVLSAQKGVSFHSFRKKCKQISKHIL